MKINHNEDLHRTLTEVVNKIEAKPRHTSEEWDEIADALNNALEYAGQRERECRHREEGLVKRNPCTDPDKMHGAADGFPGSDYP